jgi:hypothetical protein
LKNDFDRYVTIKRMCNIWKVNFLEVLYHLV